MLIQYPAMLTQFPFVEKEVLFTIFLITCFVLLAFVGFPSFVAEVPQLAPFHRLIPLEIWISTLCGVYSCLFLLFFILVQFACPKACYYWHDTHRPEVRAFILIKITDEGNSPTFTHFGDKSRLIQSDLNVTISCNVYVAACWIWARPFGHWRGATSRPFVSGFLRLVATFLRVAYINYQRPAAGESEGQRRIKQIEFKKKKKDK